jgi:hypothetical protein
MLNSSGIAAADGPPYIFLTQMNLPNWPGGPAADFKLFSSIYFEKNARQKKFLHSDFNRMGQFFDLLPIIGSVQHRASRAKRASEQSAHQSFYLKTFAHSVHTQHAPMYASQPLIAYFIFKTFGLFRRHQPSNLAASASTFDSF